MTRIKITLFLPIFLLVNGAESLGAVSAAEGVVRMLGRSNGAQIVLSPHVAPMLRTLREVNPIFPQVLQEAHLASDVLILPTQESEVRPGPQRVYVGVLNRNKPDSHRILQVSLAQAQNLQQLISDGDVDGAQSVLNEAFEAKYILNKQGYGAAGLLVPVEPGKFMMGSPNDEAGRWVNEDQHEVTLTHRILMGATKLPQALFAEVMNLNPSKIVNDFGPVEMVSYLRGAEFLNELSVQESLVPAYVISRNSHGGTQKIDVNGASVYETLGFREGKAGYRFPTEAEWEYAARAGSELPYPGAGGSDKIGDYAWYSANSDGKTHPVATLKPNAWGLRMVGNVWEWMHDWYDEHLTVSAINPEGTSRGFNKVIRGGSINNIDRNLRFANRNGAAPDVRVGDIGLRVVRSIP